MTTSVNPTYWVVEFSSDSTVEVVPETWLIEGPKSYWPCDPKLNKKLKSQLVRSNVNPLEHPRYLGEVFDCCKLISTDDYEKAERAACRAQDQTEVRFTESEADSTPTNSRKLRPRILRYPEDKIDTTLSNIAEDPALESLQNLFIPQQEDSPLDGVLFTADEISQTDLNIDVVPPAEIPSGSTAILMQDLITPNENILADASIVSNEQLCGLQREIKEFQRVLLREVEKLKRDIEQILQVVQASHAGGDSGLAVEIPGIPVDNAAALETLECWLAESDNSSKLVLYLRRIGGSDIENIVKRALGKFVGPNLARLINFTGKNGKIAFDHLSLHSCLKSACRKNPTDTDPTDSQIDCIVRKWFGGSGDRHGGRNERMKRQHQKPAQEDN